jgi:molybdenum cofactor cytidylyltransferase
LKAIILAAGKSSRMGVPKWSLRMATGETFLDYLVLKYLLEGVESVLVVNERDKEMLKKIKLPHQLTVVVNPNPALGRVSSIQQGLGAAGEVKACFIHNIDNPFVSHHLVTGLLHAMDGHDCVVPVFDGKGGHPLLISKKLMDDLMQCRHPLPVLSEFITRYKVYRIEFPERAILLNINSPSDYHDFMAIPLP